MPVPTPPNKDLFKVTLPTPKMRADSKKLHDQIKRTTAEVTKSLDISENQLIGIKVEVPSRNDGETAQQYSDRLDQLKPRVKKTPFTPPEHLMQNPFRENDELRKLGYKLKKETDNKKPVKRSPKRTMANKTTGVK